MLTINVWLKVGGDKGIKSFKMSFGCAIVANPNSVKTQLCSMP